ncbi:Ig-like domain-containing protein, partial [Pasteurellaceae bacterium 20609_3]|uniref:Ig-like domain-containing protein n=1 Tax=Spirabiliibacterium mucosae TaxID=28156 RepID=UPI001AAD4F7A
VPGGNDGNDDGKGDEAPVITFPEDSNADRTLNKDEVGSDNKTPVKITVPEGTEEGDTLVVEINGEKEEIPVTPEIIKDGYTKEVPTNDIDNIDVKAHVKDPAGNESAEGTGSVKVDTTAPNAQTTTLVIDTVAGDDNQLSLDEAKQPTAEVKGTVTGEFKAGDEVVVTVDGNEHKTTVNGEGKFTVNVPVSELQQDADKKVEAKITATDAAGNKGEVTAEPADYT